MFNPFKKIFSKRSSKQDKKNSSALEQAFFQDLISKEEFLRLKMERAERELKDFLKKDKI